MLLCKFILMIHVWGIIIKRTLIFAYIIMVLLCTKGGGGVLTANCGKKNFFPSVQCTPLSAFYYVHFDQKSPIPPTNCSSIAHKKTQNLIISEYHQSAKLFD